MEKQALQDFWPSDLSEDAGLVSPVAILRQQAQALGEKLNHRVTAEVHSEPLFEREGEIAHFFYLAVPSLDEYKYKLLHVIHAVPFYPLRIHTTVNLGPFEVGSEDEFLTRLREILQSSGTKEVLRALLAQAKG